MNPLKRDLTIYRGSFSGLKLEAFGKVQVLKIRLDVEIYQHPENIGWWLARPYTARGTNSWCASSPQAVMSLVEDDFETCLEPWQAWSAGGLMRPQKLGMQIVKPGRSRRA